MRSLAPRATTSFAHRYAARAAAMLALAMAPGVDAAGTLQLPPASCTSDTLLGAGFEDLPTPLPARDDARTVDVAGFGSRTYYLRLPATVSQDRRLVAVVALHGAAGPGNSPAAAQATRNSWAPIADANGFVVAAPASNGTQGGWGVSADFAMLDAILTDLHAQLNVEPTRTYLWGFSAGAHFGHAIALDNPDTFAAYAVSAGALGQYACSVPPQFFSPPCATYLPAVARKVPVEIRIGTSDSLYPMASGDPTRFLAGGWIPGQVRYVEFAGGHTYTTPQLGEIWTGLCQYAVVP